MPTATVIACSRPSFPGIGWLPFLLGIIGALVDVVLEEELFRGFGEILLEEEVLEPKVAATELVEELSEGREENLGTSSSSRPNRAK